MKNQLLGFVAGAVVCFGILGVFVYLNPSDQPTASLAYGEPVKVQTFTLAQGEYEKALASIGPTFKLREE
jgi:hypothetical protein